MRKDRNQNYKPELLDDLIIATEVLSVHAMNVLKTFMKFSFESFIVEYLRQKRERKMFSTKQMSVWVTFAWYDAYYSVRYTRVSFIRIQGFIMG